MAIGSFMRYDEVEHAVDSASALLRAMANERRLLILCQLSRGEHCVGDLRGLIGVSQSALSQHLAKLRHDGLVQTRRDAQTVYYSLRGDSALRILDALENLLCKDSRPDEG